MSLLQTIKLLSVLNNDLCNFWFVELWHDCRHWAMLWLCLCEWGCAIILCAKFLGSNPSDKPQENLEIWDAKTGQLVHAFLQKKQHEWWALFNCHKTCFSFILLILFIWLIISISCSWYSWYGENTMSVGLLVQIRFSFYRSMIRHQSDRWWVVGCLPCW